MRTQADRNAAVIGQSSSATRQSWPNFLLLYPIYAALARQCELENLPYPPETTPSPWRDTKRAEDDFRWLDEIDRKLQAVHIRKFLATPSAAREEGLRVFLRRHLFKPEKTSVDRDKIDLLVVQYFALCAPPNSMASVIELTDVARVLQPVLGETEIASLACCEPLGQILEAAKECRCLRDFVDQGLVEKGRITKENAGGMFYDPAALVNFCRFNFLLRRAFIQLLHADLRTIGRMLIEVEKRNIRFVDCRRAGFSATEPVAKLREFHNRWKAPFHQDYSQGAALGPYEQLMSLRADLEDALDLIPLSSTQSESGTADGKHRENEPSDRVNQNRIVPGPRSGSSVTTSSSPEVYPAKHSTTVAPNTASHAPGNANASPPTATHSPLSCVSDVSVVDIENCEEKIWEQLIATPPVRGRSMTTVTVEGTRILLSAWEVAAFVSDSGPNSDDLRKAIVARAMLGMAIERRKQLVDLKTLHQTLVHARAGIRHFQERIEQLKRGNKIDAAVNLSISLKRLLSVAEEAELLQAGTTMLKENL